MYPKVFEPYCACRVVEVWRVCCIHSLGAKLEIDAFGRRERSKQTCIQIHNAGSAQRVASRVAQARRSHGGVAYAEALVAQHGNDASALTRALGTFDTSVTLHVVNLMRKNVVDLAGPAVNSAFQAAASHVQQAYRQYLQEWRSTKISNQSGARNGNVTIAARRTTKPQ